MANVVTQWRTGYTPGDWLALAGPTTLVVLDPAGAELGDVEMLWADVVAAATAGEVVARVARLDRGRAQSLLVVFWDSDGLRTLTRGDVTLVDTVDGQTVAGATDELITWHEQGLGRVRDVTVQLGGPAVPGPVLPLVVGAARVSGLRLDARAEAVVTSPQGAPGIFGVVDDRAGSAPAPAVEPDDGTAPLPPGVPDPEAHSSVDGEETEDTGPLDLDAPTLRTSPDLAREEMENGATELMPAQAEDATALAPAQPPATGPTVPAALCSAGHPNPPYAEGCWVCGAAVPPQEPRSVPRPVLGRLRVPDGSALDLDRPVVIGRAPSAAGVPGEQPRLLAVPSPSHDISRTHVLVAPEGWQILVTDLGSTNGTTVVTPGPGVDRVALQPGQALSVAVGTLVELGDGVAVLIDAAQ